MVKTDRVFGGVSGVECESVLAVAASGDGLRESRRAIGAQERGGVVAGEVEGNGYGTSVDLADDELRVLV